MCHTIKAWTTDSKCNEQGTVLNMTAYSTVAKLAICSVVWYHLLTRSRFDREDIQPSQGITILTYYYSGNTAVMVAIILGGDILRLLV